MNATGKRLAWVVMCLSMVFVSVGTLEAVPTSITVYNNNFGANVVADGSQTMSHSYWPTVSGNDSLDVRTWNPVNADFDGTTGSPGNLPGSAAGSQCLYNINPVTNNNVMMINSSLPNAVDYIGNLSLAANKMYTLTIAVASAKTAVVFDGAGLGLVDETAGGLLAYTAPPQPPGYTFPTWQNSGKFVDDSLQVRSNDYLPGGKVL